MVLLCLIWGLSQVATKVANEGVSPVTQAAIRSAVAAVLLFGWAALRGIALFRRDGTLVPGVLAGLLFGSEFVFMFLGLQWTDAARMAVFVYLAPCFTAVGLAWFVPGERMNARQWAGVLMAFGGLALAFSDAFTSARSTLLGDLFRWIAGGILWAAFDRRFRSMAQAVFASEAIGADQKLPRGQLFYQLAISAVMLAAAAPAQRKSP